MHIGSCLRGTPPTSLMNCISILQFQYIIRLPNILKLFFTVVSPVFLEIRSHTIELLSGVDIVCKSNICITDYQSNVSRFIKLYHTNSSNVYDVSNPDLDIDYNKIICPTFGF
jgi:hypothetical protein